MQRVILLTLILLSAALPPGAAAAPDVTLEFWTISLQPFFTDYVNSMIATYERTHPGIRIRWVDVQLPPSSRSCWHRWRAESRPTSST